MSDIVERVREFLALEDDLKDVVVASLTPEQVDTLRAFLRMETSSEKINRLETENSSLRQLLSEAETREREARAKALEDVIAAIETGREVRDPCCRDYSTIVVDYTIEEAVEIIRAMQSEER